MIEIYLDVRGSETKKIKVKTYYSKGGMCFSGEYDKRGYYVSVRLVEVKEVNGIRTESFKMSDVSYKQLMMEVGRASKKAEKITDSVSLDIAKPIIDRICTENNIQVE